MHTDTPCPTTTAIGMDLYMDENLPLVEGKNYKYTQLMDALEGGSRQFYLPFKGQRVFAAFLNQSLNPDAPNIILVGSKPRVAFAGALLAKQQMPIPVFVKQTTDTWRFAGQFRSSKIIEESAAKAMAKSASREDVAFALGLEKVVGDAGILPTFQEGQSGQVTRNVYERNDEARAVCLQHYGYRCCVCDLLFSEEYGERGAKFIHVHHLNPLHSAGGSVFTSPIKDLRPVCPNCHAMLHKGGVLITPDQLREAYWSDSSQTNRKARGGRKHLAERA